MIKTGIQKTTTTILIIHLTVSFIIAVVVSTLILLLKSEYGAKKETNKYYIINVIEDNTDHNELDAESVTSEDEEGSSGNSPETPVDTPTTCLLSKRKSTGDEEEYTAKRTK